MWATLTLASSSYASKKKELACWCFLPARQVFRTFMSSSNQLLPLSLWLQSFLTIFEEKYTCFQDNRSDYNSFWQSLRRNTHVSGQSFWLQFFLTIFEEKYTCFRTIVLITILSDNLWGEIHMFQDNRSDYNPFWQSLRRNTHVSGQSFWLQFFLTIFEEKYTCFHDNHSDYNPTGSLNAYQSQRTCHQSLKR